MIERHPVDPSGDRDAWLALRQRDVTASAVAALLGIHEYATPYSIWAEKTGRLALDQGESGAMRRGRHVEEIALKVLREERPEWTATAGDSYYRDPDIRLGATPDVMAIDPERGPGIVQVKSVHPSVLRKKWRDEDGAVEVPLWIACQALTEAHLTGASWAAVAALVIDYEIDLQIIDIPLHVGVVERLRAATVEFWEMVESGRTPDPDWNRDASLANRFHEFTEATLDLSGSNSLPGLLARRARRKGYIKAAEAQVAQIDGEIRTAVGGAMAASLPGWRITAKPVSTQSYTVQARTTRPLRITRSKEARA